MTKWFLRRPTEIVAIFLQINLKCPIRFLHDWHLPSFKDFAFSKKVSNATSYCDFQLNILISGDRGSQVVEKKVRSSNHGPFFVPKNTAGSEWDTELEHNVVSSHQCRVWAWVSAKKKLLDRPSYTCMKFGGQRLGVRFALLPSCTAAWGCLCITRRYAC